MRRGARTHFAPFALCGGMLRPAKGGTLPRARLAYVRRERGEPWTRIARQAEKTSNRSKRVPSCGSRVSARLDQRDRPCGRGLWRCFVLCLGGTTISSHMARRSVLVRRMDRLEGRPAGGRAGRPRSAVLFGAADRRENAYSNTASGSSRLSEPSKSMAARLSAATAPSIALVCAVSASIAACTRALPAGLPSPICWS